ncbi:hypothetical protein AB1Y20_004640 [Prymnesium parvum]|uniref:Uncharacterized protein n=1 Tax=Prymnesium parvum TaxID=97485 RepID=A0AB34IWS5_PRYPA
MQTTTSLSATIAQAVRCTQLGACRASTGWLLFVCSTAALADLPPVLAADTLPPLPARASPRDADRGYEDLIDQARILSLPRSEQSRVERLQELEDERLVRCRDAPSLFEQCFYFDLRTAESERGGSPGDSSAAVEGNLPRRGPPTW